MAFYTRGQNQDQDQQTIRRLWSPEFTIVRE